MKKLFFILFSTFFSINILANHIVPATDNYVYFDINLEHTSISAGDLILMNNHSLNDRQKDPMRAQALQLIEAEISDYSREKLEEVTEGKIDVDKILGFKVEIKSCRGYSSGFAWSYQEYKIVNCKVRFFSSK